MAAKPLDVIVRQPTTKTMNKMVEQMAQMLLPSRPLHGEVDMDPLRLSLTTRITPASPKRASPQPNRSLNRTTSTKASRQHQPPLKYSPSKKKRRNFKRNLTCRRQSSTLAFNASSTALKNSILKNSTKSTSGTPTTPSKVSSTISKPTGARSQQRNALTPPKPSISIRHGYPT
jgi:hypothetical protein